MVRALLALLVLDPRYRKKRLVNLDWRESCGGVWAVHSSQSEPG